MRARVRSSVRIRLAASAAMSARRPLYRCALCHHPSTHSHRHCPQRPMRAWRRYSWRSPGARRSPCGRFITRTSTIRIRINIRISISSTTSSISIRHRRTACVRVSLRALFPPPNTRASLRTLTRPLPPPPPPLCHPRPIKTRALSRPPPRGCRWQHPATAADRVAGRSASASN
jgi:hypothetical protein